MQTIRIPKNLLFLSDKLPQPNYEITKNNNTELPEIKTNQRKKQKIRESLIDNHDSNSILADPGPQIASIIRKKNSKDISNENNLNNQIRNSNEEDFTNALKILDRREKSPSG